MRKLLMLALVLGMASGAYAGLTISVHEVGGAEYNGRDLVYSEELWLDIDAEGVTAADYAYFALVVDTGLGTIGGGVVGTMPPAGNLDEIFDPALGYMDFFPTDEGEDGITGYVGDSGGGTLDGLQIDEILFHCEGIDDATVRLITSPDFATFTVADTLVIGQIPEPMTMALLGLGGLFLRRRK